jgi:osmotically inducible lipoprotein OsmB
MIKYLLAIAVALAGTLGLAGCASRAETIGTAGGAVGGAAVGSAVTGGSTIGTVGGAAAGGIIGDQLGKEYDRKHK